MKSFCTCMYAKMDVIAREEEGKCQLCLTSIGCLVFERIQFLPSILSYQLKRQIKYSVK